MSGGDIPIDELLAGLGLSGEVRAAARAILEEERLTNPRKQRIALAKAEACRSAIDLRWRRGCEACLAAGADDGRRAVTVPKAACPTCAGSNSRSAVEAMVQACATAGVRRIVTVGGSPSLRQELTAMVAGRLELRLIDGTRATDGNAAKGNLAWADLVVVLGSSELGHKVSALYSRDPKSITCARRGIEALALAVAGSDIVTNRRPTPG